MLTTIPPPIVLPKTNLLKIHPIPSSPSSANSMQREWEWEKRKSEEVRGDEYRNTKQFSKLLCFRNRTENVHSRSMTSHFLFFSFFFLACTCWLFAMVDLQLNGIRLEVEWSPCRRIDYPLTKQYRQTHFDVSEIISEKLLSMTLLTNTQVASVFKSCAFEDKRGVCSEWLDFTFKGQ